MANILGECTEKVGFKREWNFGKWTVFANGF